MNYKLAPSLLAADFTALGRAIDVVASSGAQYIHFDVMDGHFVSNLSFGLPILNSIRQLTDLPFDVHLMVSNPLAMIEPFARAGADILTIHTEAVIGVSIGAGMGIGADMSTDMDIDAYTQPEAFADLRIDTQTAALADLPGNKPTLMDACLARIKSLGKKAAVAIRPATPVSVLFPWLHLLDMVLIMSVEPGYGGQPLMPDTLRKAEALAAYAAKHRLTPDIEMDGGINLSNVRTVLDAGVNVVVTGSAVFTPSPEETAANTRAFAAVLTEYAREKERLTARPAVSKPLAMSKYACENERLYRQHSCTADMPSSYAKQPCNAKAAMPSSHTKQPCNAKAAMPSSHAKQPCNAKAAMPSTTRTMNSTS